MGPFRRGEYGILALLLAWAWPEATASGQEVARYHLRDPMAATTRFFGHVSGLFELPDRRLVIADEGDQLIFLVDLQRRTVVQLGSTGSGSGRYRFPRSLLPLGSDSVAIEDVGSDWLIVVRSNGTIGGSVGLLAPGVRPMSGAPPVGGDTLGRLYAIDDSAFTRKGPNSDSSPVMRWSAGTPGRSAVAYLPMLAPERGPRFGGSVRGFRVRPQLVVGADGRIAIIHVSPYAVQVIAPTGARVNGKPIPYQRFRIGAGDTLRWHDELRRPRPAILQTPGGAFQVGMFPFDESGPVVWPRYLPPFEDDAGRFAPDGRLWIQRAVPVGHPAEMDVVDGNGRLTARISAPQGSRLLGFGRSGVFLATPEQGKREGVRLYRHPTR